MRSPSQLDVAWIWQGLSHFAEISDPALLWPEILDWLLKQLGADGAWLAIDSPPTVCVERGALSEITRGWLLGWNSSSPAPTCSRWMTASPDPEGVLLCVEWPSAPAHMAARLALSFADQMPPSDQDCQAIAGTVQALAGIAHRIGEAQQTRERLSRFRYLYEVGQAIASTLDLHQVLRQSTERVTEVLGAEASTLMLVDEEHGELVFEIPAGPAEDILREHRMPMDKGVAGWAATRGEPVVIADVAADERFYTAVDRLTGYQTRSIMAVPLQVQGKTVGVVEVINKKNSGRFTADDVQWLSILAPLIAVAVENARLFTALREERDRIVAAEETVRHELARNLHDGPAQIMAAMVLNIDMARRQLTAGPEKMAAELNFLDSLAQEANQEIRDLLFSLRPVSLETHGLTAALEQQVERLQNHVTYQMHLEVEAVQDSALDPKTAATVFVIVQEALNNIQKHARATNVWIRLGLHEDDLWVEVIDDGVGFNVRQVEADYSRLGSFGLLNMRERARLIEGQTRIDSPAPTLGHGTRVRVDVPRERRARGG